MELDWDQAGVAERIRLLLAGIDGYAERRMFGAIGFFTHGNLIGGPNKEVLLVRVGAEGMQDALAEPDAEPMLVGERTMNGFVRVALDDLDDERLRFWVERGLAVAAALPPK